MGKTAKITGLAALGVFGALSIAACGSDQTAASTPGPAANADQAVAGTDAGYSHKKETGPVGRRGESTTPTYSHKKETGPVRRKGDTGLSPTIPGPAGDLAPATQNVEIQSSRGLHVTVRNVVHVDGGANNGHWETTGPSKTLNIDYDTAYYAALSLCDGGDGVTLGDDGTGNRRCAGQDAIDTLHESGSGMTARVTFDSDGNITEFREIYVP